MVGIRLFLIFILCFLLFGASAYGLRPFEDMGETKREDALPPEIEEAIAEIEREKQALMKDISPLRDERENTLRPFVYESAPLDVESPRPVKHLALSTVEKTPAQAESLTSRPLPNRIFFSLIVIACFSAYFFLRPKP